MRDDIASANIGRAPKDYDNTFFWRSYRDIEMFISRLLAKGPITVTDLAADTITVAGNIRTTAGQVQFADTADISSAADTLSSFRIGAFSSLNLMMDSNEMQAASNGVASGYTINPFGGTVGLGSSSVATIVSVNWGQLRFPATQNPSTDVNTLDDYQESDYTPVVTGSTTAGAGTYTTQLGRYTKIGRLVFFQIDVAWTAHTGTGNLRFNIPFTSGGSINTLLSIASEGLAFANQLQATTISGTATGQIVQISSSGTITAIAMDTNARLLISGCYSV